MYKYFHVCNDKKPTLARQQNPLLSTTTVEKRKWKIENQRHRNGRTDSHAKPVKSFVSFLSDQKRKFHSVQELPTELEYFTKGLK